MFGSQIRDKDGVAATVGVPVASRGSTGLSTLYCSQVVFAEMVASLQQSGQTARGFLEGLYKTYGYFQVRDIAVTLPLNLVSESRAPPRRATVTSFVTTLRLCGEFFRGCAIMTERYGLLWVLVDVVGMICTRRPKGIKITLPNWSPLPLLALEI